MWRRLAAALVVSLLTLTLLGAGASSSPVSLVVSVYADGTVGVDYLLMVEATAARINVSLFGQVYVDLLAVAPDGTVLDTLAYPGGVTIDTLGTTQVRVTYATPDLARKAGRIWTVALSAPVAFTVILPEAATVLGYSETPLAISSFDGRPSLTLPAGSQAVDYTLTVVGTREYAFAVLTDAEETVNEVKAQGVLVPEAEQKLDAARGAFLAENYAQAEVLAREAKQLALATAALAVEARTALDQATVAIETATRDGRTVGLAAAEARLADGEAALIAGDYTRARTLADEARRLAEVATVPVGPGREPEPEPEPIPGPDPGPGPGPGGSPSPIIPTVPGVGPVTGLPFLGIVVGLAAATGVSVAVWRRRRSAGPPPPREVRSIDVARILTLRPDLRADDREALQFLADAGGEAFEAELRDRFQLPRTTVWRLIKRLQREELVEIRKVGGQNLVRIRDEYGKR